MIILDSGLLFWAILYIGGGSDVILINKGTFVFRLFLLA